MAVPWIYVSGFVFRRHFPVGAEVVREEVPMLKDDLKDVELKLDKLQDRIRDDGIREVVYGRLAQKMESLPKDDPANCLWCKELITDKDRKYFCSDTCEEDWIKRADRQEELEDNPGVGSGG